ncbi:hypothetical protein C5L14_01435 [Labrys okinawensis]|uniref:Uncharacterized protein n=1 Tax=Labrys okinawensis TaxID=346911 RepID=A0A2S9QIW8_9HYPH|nr:hypothetical protein [Labrys okinawensis]PRH89285.1 hypothetical protein C5L14_01435 [Labrys okinawensis]
MRKFLSATFAAIILAYGGAVGLAQPLTDPAASASDEVIERAPGEIRTVSVATFDELSIPQRIAANQQIAETGPGELRHMRKVIAETPRLQAALEEYGSAPSSVIAMTFDDTDEVTLVIAS